MNDWVPVRDLLDRYIGGGWGAEEGGPDLQSVAIIRGADFPSIELGNPSGLPVRYETIKRVATRALEPGDVVLEISGGTKDRPTGRSVFVSEDLLRRVPVTVIPASFCRLLRPKASLAEPRYLYYWLRGMYAEGRTWGYQVQSTGLANFQMELFLDRELVRLPPLAEQRRIAGVLGALDDLMETNQRLADSCAGLRQALVRRALAECDETVPLSSVAGFVNGKNFTKGASDRGLPVIRTPEIRRGPDASTVRSDVAAEQEFRASAGDILFVWSGSLMVERWLYEEGLVNQHIFKVIPEPGCPSWLVFALIEHQMPWFLGLAADKATTMGHIQRGHLDALVPWPGDAAIRELAQTVEPLWDQELALRIEMQQLAHTRDELLPLLLSGRVSVREVAA